MIKSSTSFYGEKVRLPSGDATEWDMTKLTDDQLQYEYDLAYEILTGIYINGELRIEGMRTHQSNGSLFKDALRTWERRLARAKDELVDRAILS